MKAGYVKVILTTNFDRLLEIALSDLGIQPTVISSPDHLEGALPLVHTQCTVIKIHGDYLDTRIRNTSSELAAYPVELDALLDRVFDEYGLVVAGWSADWDEALRAAIVRAPGRRFSTYWASRGDPSALATDLIARRGGIKVSIGDADSFFENLSEKVRALEEYAQPHPLSAAVAVATLKRYLSEDKYAIALDDLISRELENVSAAVRGADYTFDSRDLSGAAILRRLRMYEASTNTLTRMAFVAGRWSSPSQVTAWIRSLSKLAQQPVTNGVTVWLDLQIYPATILFYAFGIGAVMAERWQLLSAVFSARLSKEGQQEVRAVERLPIWGNPNQASHVMKLLLGHEREYTPLQNHLEAMLLPFMVSAFASENEFHLAFDKLEVLAALAYAIPAIERGGHYWTLPGSYAWRRQNSKSIFDGIRQSLQLEGDNSPYVLHKLAGATATQGQENLRQLGEFSAKLHMGY